jgi:hypothetical protein
VTALLRPPPRFVLDKRHGRDQYAEFLRASVAPFDPRALALRLRIACEHDGIERIACSSRHGRPCVYLDREGRVRDRSTAPSAGPSERARLASPALDPMQ